MLDVNGLHPSAAGVSRAALVVLGGPAFSFKTALLYLFVDWDV